MVPKRRIRSETLNVKAKGEISMRTEKNVQVVKDFFAAIGSGHPKGYGLKKAVESCYSTGIPPTTPK
jgi:hypothetical protein